MTKVAWGRKRDQIVKVTPEHAAEGLRVQACREAVPQGVRRRLREAARVRAGPGRWCTGCVPKIGPFRSLAFRAADPRSRTPVPGEFHRDENALPRVARRAGASHPACCRIPIFDTGLPASCEANIRSPTPRTTNCSTSSPAIGFADVPVGAAREPRSRYYGAVSATAGQRSRTSRRDRRRSVWNWPRSTQPRQRHPGDASAGSLLP